MSGFEESLDRIVEDTWATILELPVVREDPFRVAGVHGRTFAGIVNISGEWDGAVALQVSEPLARRAAEIMFALPAEAISPDEMQDALAELANMVGGNTKSLLPEPSRLALPVVIEGTDYRIRLPGATQLLQSVFTSDGELFTVTMLQRAAAVAD